MTSEPVSGVNPPRTLERRMFIPGASESQAREIQASALRPEGTLVFSLDAGAIYEQQGSVVLVQIPTGATLLRVTRDATSTISFLHSSPGTGTREASVALPERAADGRLQIYLVWSSTKLALYVGVPGIGLLTAEGQAVARRVRVTDDAIYEIGAEGIEVIAYTAFDGRGLAVRDAAIDTWEATKRAVEVHMAATVAEGQLGVVVQANLAIVMLATGIETYSERRFTELPLEGRKHDIDSFVRRTVPARVRSASATPESIAAAMDLARVDFGNYEACRRAFAAGYGIRFGLLGLPASTLTDVQRALKFRQRIVHVSPLVGLLNQPDVPRQPPVFSSSHLASQYLQSVDAFLRAMHSATLRLPAADR